MDCGFRRRCIVEHYKKGLASSQIIILGFAGAILFGAFLLMLPFSTADGRGASFGDALFTATSATCVTGLVVQDTATYWSAFGQGIILCLIQIGGMGVITVTIAISLISGRKIGLRQRSIMQDSISAHQVGGIVRLTNFILKATFAIELLGAALMFPVFSSEVGFFKGIWYSIFHSVSAFCNAGFDLMGTKGHYSSLTHYATNPIINIVIMSLIVVGGIGFLTWDDIKTHKFHFHKYHMQTKVVLVTSICLIFFPALYFLAFEMKDAPLSERLWYSMFQSVTARTAGFNTIDLTLLSEGGIVIMIMLMLVGGSPGSTAGGMKTTTLAVMVSTTASVFSHREHTSFYGRRIDDETVRNAATIVTIYITLFVAGALIISNVEGLPLQVCLFETASAIATVGLTLGVTPELSGISRAILIGIMYFGRVGGLTLIFAATAAKKGNTARFPQEKLTVG